MTDRPKVSPADIDYQRATDEAASLHRLLRDAGYVAPELQQSVLNQAARHMNNIATALRFTGGPKAAESPEAKED